MNKLAVAAIAATLSLAVAAPAFAQEKREENHEGRTEKKVVMHRDHDRDRDRHHGWREGRRERGRDHDRTKIVIKHHHHKTVIKKRES